MTALELGAAMRGRDSRAEIFRRAGLWLLFLAPLFYLSYGGANWLAAQRADVPAIVYDWERGVPFIAWTIVPYWSINLFYAASLFVNDSVDEVGRLARRYLTAQLIAVACFVAFPLQATFAKPETGGIPGFFFDLLGGFDKPFNQAPSLHIALLVIIWDHLRAKLSPALRLVWHGWCFLIGVSVLTTFQHHFIDIPTGAALGVFALWLFPAGGRSPLAAFALTEDLKARRLGSYYASGAALFFALAVLGTFATPSALLLLWPAAALAIVASGYFGVGVGVFQKSPDGSVSLASRILLTPYRLGASVNAWAWGRKLPASIAIAEGVHLGRFPLPWEAKHYATIIDMTAEFVRPSGREGGWRAFPSLDLVATDPATIREAARTVEAARANGPVLVCCALGFQRSAQVAAAWLVDTGRAASAGEAVAILRRSGRPVHVGPAVIGAPVTEPAL